MKVVPIDNGINFRDLGGIPASNNHRLKPGLLFRSGGLSQLSQTDCEYLEKRLHLTSILDYRDLSEVEQRPNILWPSAQYYNVPANPLSNEISADLGKEVANITNTKIKTFDPNHFMINLYRLLPFYNPAYNKLVELLRADAEIPMLQHCAIGKDRTGVGVALTLLALGVDEDIVMDDYLLTEKLLADFREKILAEIAINATPQELANYRELFAAKQIYLSSAFDSIKDKYQTFDNWLEHDYGLTAQVREQLQNKYLTK